MQFMPARGSDTQLLIALTLRSSANPSGAVPCHGPSCYCCAERSPPDPFPGLASPVCYREASAAEGMCEGDKPTFLGLGTQWFWLGLVALTMPRRDGDDIP